MTQEDKDLLLKDICARLPYKVKCQIAFDEEDIHIETLESVSPTMLFNQVTTSGSVVSIENVKPYLRPMSSMTEEEKDEMHRMLSPEGTALYRNDGIAISMNHFGDFVPYEYMSRIIDWLNKNMFDYRGLIEKGLALEATEGMYDIN